MRIRISFHGGPLNGMESRTTELPPLKLFWPPREKTIVVYRRENETDYLYSPDLSGDLTAIYDQAKAKFNPSPDMDVEEWTGSPPSF